MSDLTDDQLIEAIKAIDVPEPSPLFWDQLSDRVRDAVAEESQAPLGGWGWTWKVLAPFAAAAVAIVVAALYFGAPRPSGSSAPPTEAAPVAAAVPLPPLGDQDDPSLAIVASLAAQVDEASAVENALVTHPGGIDDAVNTLSDTERAELGRLLRDAIAKS